MATQHETIDSLVRSYRGGNDIAAATLFKMILEVDASKHGLATTFVVAPSGRKGELEITQGLPGAEVIPTVAGYRYIKNRDAIEPIARPEPHIARLYRLLIAQLALRTMWVMFAADEANRLTAVSLTCYADRPVRAAAHEPVLRFWSTKSALNDVISWAFDDPTGAIQALMRHDDLRVHLAMQVFRQHGLPLHRDILAEMCLAKHPDTFDSRRAVLRTIEAHPELFQPMGAGVIRLTPA